MLSIRGILFLVILASCMGWSLKRPQVGFYLLVVMLINKAIIYDALPQVYEVLHVPRLLLFVVLLSIFFNGMFNLWARESSKITILFLLFFLLACYLSLYIAGVEVFWSQYITQITFSFLLFSAGIICLRTERDVYIFLYLIVLSLICSSILAYYNYKILGWSIPVPSYLIDRNYYSGILISCIPLLVFLSIIVKKNYLKWIFIGFVLLFIACGVASYSRGAFVTLFFCSILLYQIVPSKKKYIIFCLFLVLFASIRLSQSYLDRLNTMKDYETEGSALGRIATYTAAVGMFKSSPLTGVGVGRFNSQFWDYCPDEYRVLPAIRPWKSIHCIYLQVLSETGVLGGFFFLGFIILVLLPLPRLSLKGPFLPQQELLSHTTRFCFLLLCVNRTFLPGAYDIVFYVFATFVVVTRNYTKRSIESRQIDNEKTKKD